MNIHLTNTWCKYALILSVLFCSFVHAAAFNGRVTGVADGDTVTVLDGSNIQHKIRLAGIDAPEKKQAYGNRSKQRLSDLIFDKAVQVETTKKIATDARLASFW
jgi:endonuclease YncB( thermonuclease family)